MTAKRLVLALLIALAVSGVFTFWLSRRLQGRSGAAPVKQTYVAASRALDAGEALKPDNLQYVDWPVSVPIAGAFAKPESLTGRVVLYPLAQGEPVLERDLAAAGAGSGLTAKIPPGMRALSLRSDDVVGVAGFLLPGTHVDVLVTFRTDKSPEPTTATVLQDVEVLAAGHQIDPDPEGKAASVDVVTLLLKPQDADRVVLASTQGTIHFVLRNGSDRGRTDSLPIGLSQLVNAAPAAAAPVRAVAKPAAKPYAVQTVMGDQKTVTSF